MLDAKDAIFVAPAGDDVIGWCDIRLLPFLSFAHRGTVGMGLVAGFCGQGISRLPLNVALSEDSLREMTHIELSARTDNARQSRFYDRPVSRPNAFNATPSRRWRIFDALSIGIVQQPRV